MQLYYKGSDIYKKVSVNKCVVDLYAERESDTLTLRFNDVKGLWSKWGVNTGDEISFVHEAVKTGRMYIRDEGERNGLYTVVAMSAPKDFHSGTFKSWEEVKFRQMASEVAARHGLAYEGYDVADRTYTYLAQRGEPDSAFLQHRCQLEGCAMIVRDGKVVVYDERSLESSPASETLVVSVDGVYDYSISQVYGSCEVIAGQYSASFTAPGATSSAVYRPDRCIQVGSQAEAQRFAQNLLRLVNKYQIAGCIRRKLSLNYAPGSVLRLETVKASKWDGKVFVTHVRHDFLRNETKIWFRRPLEGY